VAGRAALVAEAAPAAAPRRRAFETGEESTMLRRSRAPSPPAQEPRGSTHSGLRMFGGRSGKQGPAARAVAPRVPGRSWPRGRGSVPKGERAGPRPRAAVVKRLCCADSFPKTPVCPPECSAAESQARRRAGRSDRYCCNSNSEPKDPQNRVRLGWVCHSEDTPKTGSRADSWSPRSDRPTLCRTTCFRARREYLSSICRAKAGRSAVVVFLSRQR
jgi:hypothetical protein